MSEPTTAAILRPSEFKHFVDHFNALDDERYPQAIPNAGAWDWLRVNIPLFECPDQPLTETYYFRWWVFRKHLKLTEDGYVVTEFLPDVPWAGRHNTISCAAGHHFRELRWLHDQRYARDYARFWFRGGGEPRRYSFWAADSVWQWFLVTGDGDFAVGLLDDLIANHHAWEASHRDANGLYWQLDDRDGMEVSVGGSGYRVTLNSYQYGDALAIGRLATLAGRPQLARAWQRRASTLWHTLLEQLWDEDAQFFKVRPRGDGTPLADVRELHGYTPWYFGLADPHYAPAWAQLRDPAGFAAPFGPTTAEQRHPRFRIARDGHHCQWNGPSWPFATTMTLTALSNLLHRGRTDPQAAQDVVTDRDWFDLLRTYAASHRLTRPDGLTVPWLDENLDPYTGEWLCRSLRHAAGDPSERGRDYNHSAFADLVICGLAGLVAGRAEDLVIDPLVPEGEWDWWCLDNVPFRGRVLTILYDRDGERYGRGRGLRALLDGQEFLATSRELPSVAPIPAPETSAGWHKYLGNPVLGGPLGTCFDLSALHEDGLYRMWFSWRPQRSLALTTSDNGINWSRPRLALGPEPATGWEDDLNRPSVVRRADGYHLWYTGQAHGRSAIGYATSPDGLTWTRASDLPVLVADEPWERVAVMCPHVLWDEEQGLWRMWYSGGEQYEPDALGYATSPDGLRWTKHPTNPIFAADPAHEWEQHKVTACQVVRHGDWWLMFYVGFRDVHHAQIGLARSRDGLTGWERHPANPIVRPGVEQWDHDACYKPFALWDGWQWLLWYNGRHGAPEQIGAVLHPGEELW